MGEWQCQRRHPGAKWEIEDGAEGVKGGFVKVGRRRGATYGDGRRLTNIGDPLLHLRVRRHADQELKLGICGSEPEGGDEA